ncbi:helix-turn-helix domain-containing protein [Microbulbifer echini]|uniref:Helix-turn-helix domain-containing protein n=1 Tax=Microbulbifer echini TaxID=1529067 RepID=A0ABV4NQG6_9GAMM
MFEAGTLGEHLRNARKLEGMTIAQLANQLGLAPSQVSKIETGKQKIAAELLPARCEAVGITLAENLHHFAQIPFPPLVSR